MTERVAFFAPYTEHVGTENALLHIADGLADRGRSVDLLRAYREWPTDHVGDHEVVSIGGGTRQIVDRLPFPWKKVVLAGRAFAGLVRYLRRVQPDVLVAGLLNAVAITARDAARVDTALLCSVQGLPASDRIRRTVWPRVYGRADRIVSPVASIADRVADLAAVERSRIDVVANPVITDEILDRGRTQPDHRWFDGEAPVVVGAGRQTYQKDFETLLRAFARLHLETDARLVVPGKTGEETAHLESIVEDLDLGDVVDFPGFVDNAYAYIGNADVFVLSSRWEGPGHVLVEALALGTPSVSTDCPSGPREILQDGDAGILVPVGDPVAMADAVGQLLDDPSLREEYATAGPSAVSRFRADRAVAAYADLIDELARDASVRGRQ